jgi:hypothetical protein
VTEISDRTLDEIKRNVPAVFEAWAPHHTQGALTFRPFDPEDPYQNVDNVRIEPEPNLELAQALGPAAIGIEAYERLRAGITEFEIVKTANKRHRSNQSTLIPSLHLQAVYDTPTTHNAIYVSSEGDLEVADINDVVASPMLAYTNLGGLPSFRVMSTSGGIDLALPVRGAKKYGMSKEARRYLTKRMTDNLDDRLDYGIMLHWALSQSRAMRIVTAAGREALSIHTVQKSLAEYLVQRKLLAVPMPINIKEIGNAQVDVLEPRVLESVKDIHDMGEEMAEAASRISGTEIYYGMPPGASELSN